MNYITHHKANEGQKENTLPKEFRFLDCCIYIFHSHFLSFTVLKANFIELNATSQLDEEFLNDYKILKRKKKCIEKVAVFAESLCSAKGNEDEFL